MNQVKCFAARLVLDCCSGYGSEGITNLLTVNLFFDGKRSSPIGAQRQLVR